FSAFNSQTLHDVFGFLPDPVENVVVAVVGQFVGDGWNLTLGLMFVLLVIFLPGGVMEGIARIGRLFRRSTGSGGGPRTVKRGPAGQGRHAPAHRPAVAAAPGVAGASRVPVASGVAAASSMPVASGVGAASSVSLTPIPAVTPSGR
ncbi:MAG: hypothetical protein ACLGHY_04625, partial [Gammaproteobacteria bacterium]